MIDLGTLGHAYRMSGASAINDRGQIIGESSTFTGLARAVLWTLQRGT